MAYTIQDLQALDDAIKNGRRRVKYKDKEVEYRDMDELMKARSFVADELKTAGVLAATRTSTSYASFSRE